MRHSVGDEQYVYPAIRRALGDDAADHELSEHAEAEEVMKALDGVEATEPKFDALIGQLINDVRHHVHEEETDILPRLVAACTGDELDRIAEEFSRAKKTAPTRTHPADKLLDPGAGVVDRVKDALSDRPV